MAVQFVKVGAASQTQEQFDQAYKTWEVKKSIIGSKIRAYFPYTTLAQDWDDFSEIVSEVYALSGTTDKVFRKERIDKLKRYFSTNTVDWESLANLELKKGGFYDFQKFYRAWFSLRKQILDRKDVLIHRILESKIPYFN